MDIKQLYENTELTQQQIADKLGIHWKRVYKYIKANYSIEYRKARKSKCYRNSKLGDLNPMTGNFAELHHRHIGRTPDCKGYMLNLKPDWYTGRKGSKHVFEHHIVVCLGMGLTCVPKGWCVHHCDLNKMNNSFDNLVLMTLGDHTRLHRFLESATTISKENTLKWVETHGTVYSHDIVYSA